MDRIIQEWIGAGTVATAAGLWDFRVGMLVVGIWLMVNAWVADGEVDADDAE